MSKLYEEFALISIENYRLYQRILENKLDSLERQLLDIIIREPDVNVNKSNEVVTLANSLKEQDPPPADNLMEPDNSKSVAPLNIENTTSDYSHIKSCFDSSLNKKKSNTPPQNHISPNAPEKPSILDSNREIKKQKLLQEIAHQIEVPQTINNTSAQEKSYKRPGSGQSLISSDTGRTRQTASKEDLRRSKRTKKPAWQTLKR